MALSAPTAPENPPLFECSRERARPTPATSRCRAYRSRLKIRVPSAYNVIAAIYQELTIIPETSALSNVFLGEVPNRWFVVDRRGMEKRFNELAEWMGVKISPHATAKTLSVPLIYMLEIMRAVHAEHDVIIMDEPTAPLVPFERSRLYDLIGRLKENNVSIISISHDLDEVLRLCDRVSVMRDGQLI